MIKLRLFALLLAVVPALGLAAGGGPLEHAGTDLNDRASLQRGAGLFMNYCSGCHALSLHRYSRIASDLELDPAVVEANLIQGDAKIGENINTGISAGDGNAWFGKAPPDLTLVARARASEFGSGADWLYTYLRQFYRDPARPTGWNNVIFANVGMPHVFWQLQGEQVATITDNADGSKKVELSLAKPGTLAPAEYDKAVADLVSFLVWMGEPVAEKRKSIGTVVLIFLAGFFVLAYALKKNYWKDIH